MRLSPKVHTRSGLTDPGSASSWRVNSAFSDLSFEIERF
jgi:hypothetical protein